MLDFVADVISVNSETVDWGPFAFDLTDSLPTGVTIASVQVRSFLRGAETTANLVTPNTAYFAGLVVAVNFSYPGDHFIGSHEIHIIVTLTGGTSQYGFRFNYVDVNK